MAAPQSIESLAEKYAGEVNLAAGDVYRLRVRTFGGSVLVEVYGTDSAPVTVARFSPAEMKRLCAVGLVHAQEAEGA